MRSALLTILFIAPHWANAQELERGLGVDLSASPVSVHSEAATDDWIGSKPPFGAFVDASINWTMPKEQAAVGLGGGAFIWGEHVLYPAYFRFVLYPSLWCDDCWLNTGFWKRITYEGRTGAMFGTIETTDGALRTDLFIDNSFRYRIGAGAEPRVHIGIRLGIFTMRGPYQILQDGEWRNAKPVFLTVGPGVWVSF